MNSLWTKRLGVLLAFGIVGCATSAEGSAQTATTGVGQDELSTGTPSTNTVEPSTGVFEPPLAACDDPIRLSQPDGSPSGYETCADGFTHRVEALECTVAPTQQGDCDPGVPEPGDCSQDADCDLQAGGYCNDQRTQPVAVCACNYTCSSDADCGAEQACHCDGTRSVCIAAACTTDADCPSESSCGLIEIRGTCGAVTRTLQCTTLDDTCRTDADCPECQQCVGSLEGQNKTCSEFSEHCEPCG